MIQFSVFQFAIFSFHTWLIILFSSSSERCSSEILFSLQLRPGSSVPVKITLIIIRLLAGLVMVLIEQISTTNI